MEEIKCLLKLFANDAITEVKEYHDQFSCKCACSNIRIPSPNELIALSSKFPNRDTLALTVSVPEKNFFYSSEKKEAAVEFIDDLRFEMDPLEDEGPADCTITIEVFKGQDAENGAISIYSLQDYFQYLRRLSLDEVLGVLAKTLNDKPGRCFEVSDLRTPFGTSTFSFIRWGSWSPGPTPSPHPSTKKKG